MGRAFMILAAGLAALTANASADPAGDVLFELRTCQGLGDSARLACFDRVLARHDTTAPMRAAPAAEPKPAADFGADSLPAKKINEAADRDEPDEIKVVVKDVSFTSNGHFVLTLENGQVWQQASADKQRFWGKAGDTIAVSHGFFTTYNLTIEGRTGLYKVIRVR